MNVNDMINKEDYIKQEQVKRTGRPEKVVKNNKKVSTYLTEYEYQVISEAAGNKSISQLIKDILTREFNLS